MQELQVSLAKNSKIAYKSILKKYFLQFTDFLLQKDLTKKL